MWALNPHPDSADFSMSNDAVAWGSAGIVVDPFLLEIRWAPLMGMLAGIASLIPQVWPQKDTEVVRNVSPVPQRSTASEGWSRGGTLILCSMHSLSLSRVPPRESHWPQVPPAPRSLLVKNTAWIHWSWFYILLKDSDVPLILHPLICSSSWNSILSSPAPSSMVPTAPSCPLSQLQCHPIRTSFPARSLSPIFSPKPPPSWQWAQG